MKKSLRNSENRLIYINKLDEFEKSHEKCKKSLWNGKKFLAPTGNWTCVADKWVQFPAAEQEIVFCFRGSSYIFYGLFRICWIFLCILTFFPDFSMIFSNFETKKFELARVPLNMEKIWISGETRQKIGIGEYFELLDFELVSLDCIDIRSLSLIHISEPTRPY